MILGVNTTPLVEGQDLNSLTFTSGRRLYTYYSPGKSISETLVNIPTGISSGFTMFVLAPYGAVSYHTQLIISFNQIFIRHNSLSYYSAWKEVNTTALT